MKIEEFKALPNGAKVVWNGSSNQITGVFTRDSETYRIEWSDNGTADGRFDSLPGNEWWVSKIGFAPSIATISVPIPAGWVATGEFRSPAPQVDCYLHQDGVTVVEAKCGNQPCLGPRVILKRIVPLTLADRLKQYVEKLRGVGAMSGCVAAAQLTEILKEFDGPESKA